MTQTKTQAQHTPGPWELWGATLIWSPKAKSNIAAVCEPRGVKHVSYDPVQISSKDFNEACANARLIAAAPELLEALKFALGYYRAIGTKKYNPYEVEQTLEKAIAKAEGG